MADARVSPETRDAEREGPASSPVRANPLMRALLGSQGSTRLSVLIYHRVLPERDPLRPTEPTSGEFESRMAWVKAHFNVIPLADAVAGLETGQLPARPLCITFDDGYADNHDIALPILQRLGLHATFFVASGFLDGGCMFNDALVESIRQAKGDELDLTAMGFGRHRIHTATERLGAMEAVLYKIRNLPPMERGAEVDRIAACIGASRPTRLMMTSAQVAALHRAGMAVGGHTVTHPVLASLAIDEASREISAGRRRLEEIVGQPIRHFAYPVGWPHKHYTAAHVELVRRLGFEAAVCSAWGTSRKGADLFQIPRFTPWDRPSWKFGLRLARNLHRSPQGLT